MIKINIGGYSRISKTAARKLFNDGKTIRMCMNKVNPVNDFFRFFTDINNTNLEDFDKAVNSYTYYNACYDLGYYAAFYIKG